MGKSKYSPAMNAQVRALGEEGLAVTDASDRLGISTACFSYWEAHHPAFREAAAKVRRNSEAWAQQRWDRLLEKEEAQLLRALEFVRAKRVKEQARWQQWAKDRVETAPGRIPDPTIPVRGKVPRAEQTPELLAFKRQRLMEVAKQMGRGAVCEEGSNAPAQTDKARKGQEIEVIVVSYADLPK